MDLGWSDVRLCDWINQLDLSFGVKMTLKQEMLTKPIIELYLNYASPAPANAVVVKALLNLARDFVQKTQDAENVKESMATKCLYRASYHRWEKRLPHKMVDLSTDFQTFLSFSKAYYHEEPSEELSLKDLLLIVSTDPKLDTAADILSTIIELSDETQRTESLYILSNSIKARMRREMNARLGKQNSPINRILPHKIGQIFGIFPR